MIYQIFAHALQKNPSAPAIITSNGKCFTYQQADDTVSQWATYFLNQGIKQNNIVAVLTANEDLHIFIFLALNRIGATYLPFDIDIPIIQVNQAIEQLSCSKVIIDPQLIHDAIRPYALPLSNEVLDEIEHLIPLNPLPESLPEITYIVSSSGTTKQKKWIPIKGGKTPEEDGLWYWRDNEYKNLKLIASDRILCARSPAYDARISEYVRAFAGGGSLYLMDVFSRKDPELILKHCESHRISCLILIASELNQVNTFQYLFRLKNSDLKHLMVTGDGGGR